MAYDTKYKMRTVQYRKEGHTVEKTAKTFKVGETTVKRWVKEYDEMGEFKKKPLARKHKKIDPQKLEAYIEAYPDAYLSEIANEFKCWPSAVRKALKKLNITRKKR